MKPVTEAILNKCMILAANMIDGKNQGLTAQPKQTCSALSKRQYVIENGKQLLIDLIGIPLKDMAANLALHAVCVTTANRHT